MVGEYSRVDTYLNIWRINDHPLKWNVSWECIFFLKLFIFQFIIWLHHFPLSSRQTLSYTTTCIKCKCVGLLLILYSCFCICCLFISLFWVLGSKASIFAVLGSILIASYIHNLFSSLSHFISGTVFIADIGLSRVLCLFSSNLIPQPINLFIISHLTFNLYFSLLSFFRSFTVFQIPIVALTVLMNAVEKYL